mmetsp:Transcript_23682/g.51791  ORF Transcript_23682/g.51791 Transcript_23682/m.51791 type:complete len:204 (-) Transcript_23682:180-791(-)
MVAVFLEDLRCGNTRLSNSPSSLPSTPLIHRRCCHATANPSLTPSSQFDYLLWSLLYTPLEKALPSPRVATALMCLWAPEETIRSMISPLPRTSRIRPLSGSYTSRTTDCSRSYCSLDMGTMDLDLDVFAAAAARCCCCCCCFSSSPARVLFLFGVGLVYVAPAGVFLSLSKGDCKSVFFVSLPSFRRRVCFSFRDLFRFPFL